MILSRKSSLLSLSLFFLFLPSLLSGGFFFPYPPSARLLRLTTKHFEVLFPENLRQEAFRTAGWAEEILPQLADELGWRPRERITVLLYSNLDFSNGFATPVPFLLIGLFATPPPVTSEIGHYDSWLRVALAHELTHLVHLDQARDLSWKLRSFFGRAPLPLIFPHLADSLPWTEGLAVFMESRLTGYGRLNGSLYRGFARNNLLFNNFPPFDRLFSGSLLYPGGKAPYIYGSLLVEHLVDRDGAEKLKETLEQTSLYPRFGFPHSVWNSEMGPKAHSQYDSLRLSLTRTLPASAPKPRILTSSGFQKEYLCGSGERVYYLSTNPWNKPRVMELDTATGKERVLFKRLMVNGLSPDGDQNLLFTAVDRLTPYRYVSDLYRFRRGHGIERLSKGLSLFAPLSLGEEGTVAFQREGSSFRLLLLSPGGRVLRTLAGPFDGYGTICYDSEEKRLYFTVHDGGSWDIFTLPLSGSPQPCRLTRNSLQEKFLLWNGGGLFFLSEGPSGQEVFAYRPGKGFFLVERIPTVLNGFAPFQKRYRSALLWGEGEEIVEPPPGEEVPVSYPEEELHRREPPPVEGTVSPARRIRYMKPTFWMPAFRDSYDRYYFGAMTYATDPTEKTFWTGSVMATPDFPSRPALFFALSHNPGLFPLFFSYDEVPSRNGRLGSFTTREIKGGAFYTWGRLEQPFRFSLLYHRESVDNTPLGYTLSGWESTLFFDTRRNSTNSLRSLGGILMGGGLRRNLRSWGSDYSFNEFFGELRLASPLPATPGVLSARLLAFTTTGEARRLLPVGGSHSFEEYADFGHSSLALQRGYSEGSFYSDRFLSLSTEVTLPIATVERGLSHFPLLFSQVGVTVYSDITWLREIDKRSLSPVSLGVELQGSFAVQALLRMSLSLGAAFPLKYGDLSQGRVYLRLGRSF